MIIEPVLYIIMRTDLDSLNSGKAMAQASHASNAFVHNMTKLDYYLNTDQVNLFEKWKDSTHQGFGTVIVLGMSFSHMRTVITKLKESYDSESYFYEEILDPTYPIKDGQVTHLIPLITWSYVFCDKKSGPGYYMKCLGDLYP